jgi:hypothetical protein
MLLAAGGYPLSPERIVTCIRVGLGLMRLVERVAKNALFLGALLFSKVMENTFSSRASTRVRASNTYCDFSNLDLDSSSVSVHSVVSKMHGE